MKIQFYLLIFLSFITNTIYSQCETYDITYRTKNSDVIFEGEIINQECFRDRNTNRIFTKNTVNIFKVFKGNVTSNRIDIITLGGEIENEIVWLSHSVDVFKNKHAVFFTKRTDRGGFGNSVRINQGAFNLDFQNDKAWNEYCTISNIEQEIFSSIEQETGIKREVKFLNSYEKSMNYILEGNSILDSDHEIGCETLDVNLAPNTLNYTLANSTYYEDNGENYYTVDILASSTIETKVYNLAFILQYSDLSFGENAFENVEINSWMNPVYSTAVVDNGNK